MNKEPTVRQSQYLAFIAQYRTLLEASPSEGDIADFFGVSGPSAHQMLVTLEAKSLVSRIPGAARSVRLSLPLPDLPLLTGSGNSTSDPAEALTSFAVYLARRLAAGNTHVVAKFAAIHQLAARLEVLLSSIGTPRASIKRSTAAVTRSAGRLSIRQVKPRRSPKPAARRQRDPKVPPSKPPSGQGSLF